MYQINPLLLEAIKLDPSKVNSYLKNPKTKKILMQAKSRIHKNPYLRNKFYDVTTLYHMTPSSNVNSIKKMGLTPKNGKLVSRATDSKTKHIAKLVYTMDDPENLKNYFRYVDYGPSGYNPVKRSMIKIRIPKSELKAHRVADPLEQINAPKNFKSNTFNFIGKSSLKHYPKSDILVSDKMKSADEFNNIYDMINALKEKGIISKKMTPKELRRWWSTQATKEDKWNIAMGINRKFPRGNYTASTVALDTSIKPEWIVGSSVAKKYNFEDQLRKDPKRTISMINDLMKRK